MKGCSVVAAMDAALKTKTAVTPRKDATAKAVGDSSRELEARSRSIRVIGSDARIATGRVRRSSTSRKSRED